MHNWSFLLIILLVALPLRQHVNKFSSSHHTYLKFAVFYTLIRQFFIQYKVEPIVLLLFFFKRRIYLLLLIFSIIINIFFYLEFFHFICIFSMSLIFDFYTFLSFLGIPMLSQLQSAYIGNKVSKPLFFIQIFCRCSYFHIDLFVLRFQAVFWKQKF